MVKMCGGAELNFWCEFSFNFVSSDSALAFYTVNLFLAENLLFCSLEIKAGKKSNFYIFHLKLTTRVKYYKNVKKGFVCSLMLQPWMQSLWNFLEKIGVLEIEFVSNLSDFYLIRLENQ